MRTDGRTDGHEEANSRFSRCCEKRLLDAILKRFYPMYFIITGTFRECTNYCNNLCCNGAELNIQTSISIGKWTCYGSVEGQGSNKD
jgi:hypothetical protein